MQLRRIACDGWDWKVITRGAFDRWLDVNDRGAVDYFEALHVKRAVRIDA